MHPTCRICFTSALLNRFRSLLRPQTHCKLNKPWEGRAINKRGKGDHFPQPWDRRDQTENEEKHNRKAPEPIAKHPGPRSTMDLDPGVEMQWAGGPREDKGVTTTFTKQHGPERSNSQNENPELIWPRTSTCSNIRRAKPFRRKTRTLPAALAMPGRFLGMDFGHKIAERMLSKCS